RWEDLPFTITMRGTEPRHARDAVLRKRLIAGLGAATRVFAVSSSLKRLSVELGIPDVIVRVVGNGVDSGRFRPRPKDEARRALGLAAGAHVLITVGGLVERKGFHRVIACMPELCDQIP